MKDGADGALGKNPDIAVDPPGQKLPDLARAPMRLITLAGDDEPLDLRRQLADIWHPPARAIGQRLEPMLLIAIEDFITGLA